MQAPVSAFHIQHEKSSEPATTTFPDGCHCSQFRPSSGPSSMCLQAAVEVTQMRTLPAKEQSGMRWVRWKGRQENGV